MASQAYGYGNVYRPPPTVAQQHVRPRLVPVGPPPLPVDNVDVLDIWPLAFWRLPYPYVIYEVPQHQRRKLLDIGPPPLPVDNADVLDSWPPAYWALPWPHAVMVNYAVPGMETGHQGRPLVRVGPDPLPVENVDSLDSWPVAYWQPPYPWAAYAVNATLPREQPVGPAPVPFVLAPQNLTGYGPRYPIPEIFQRLPITPPVVVVNFDTFPLTPWDVMEAMGAAFLRDWSVPILTQRPELLPVGPDPVPFPKAPTFYFRLDYPLAAMVQRLPVTPAPLVIVGVPFPTPAQLAAWHGPAYAAPWPVSEVIQRLRQMAMGDAPVPFPAKGQNMAGYAPRYPMPEVWQRLRLLPIGAPAPVTLLALHAADHSGARYVMADRSGARYLVEHLGAGLYAVTNASGQRYLCTDASGARTHVETKPWT